MNRRALADIRPWFTALFPRARHEPGTGAWRVSSRDLNRNLEEDLSVHPTEGGHDFGTRESCAPIDIVMKWGGAATPQDAAFLLCEELGIDPTELGWKEPRAQQQSGTNQRRRKVDGGDASPGADDVLLTEHGVALAFAERHRDHLRYCHDTGAWFLWTGSRWRQDRKHAAFSFARDLIAEANGDADFKTQAITGKASFAGGVERFARADQTLAVTADAWDYDPWSLGTPDGVVDLRTGTLRQAQLEDMITRTTAVSPAATIDCPRWLQFLDEVTASDRELIRFLRQWSGYCLTGDTREEALLFIHGPGGNGKGKFLGALQGVLGGYCKNAAMETFTASHGDRHPTDLAMLKGARMVCASETEEGRAWAEVRIKQMTGNDVITARFMRQDFFEYRPQFKLTIIGNHKPVLKNVDDAARRRFNIVPFNFKPNPKDPQLEEKLRQEWPGILRWMIEGCLDWQKNGLIRPKVVAAATDEYFAQQDRFGAWVAERCILDPNLSSRPGTLLTDFNAWAERNCETKATRATFRGWAEHQPGFRYKLVNGRDYLQRIGLKVSEEGEGRAASWSAL